MEQYQCLLALQLTAHLCSFRVYIALLDCEIPPFRGLKDEKMHISITATCPQIKSSPFLTNLSLCRKKVLYTKSSIRVSLHFFCTQIHLHRITPLLPQSSCCFQPHECLPHRFDYSCPKSDNCHAIHLTQYSKKKNTFSFLFVPS